jgi:putative transposase
LVLTSLRDPKGALLVRRLLSLAAMTMPRQVLPGTTYLLTRRTVQRELLLTPSKQVNQIVLYCLGLAAQKYGVQLHGFCVMSNHPHTVATDAAGRLPEFEGWFHEFTAKAINASMGRWGALWEPGSYSAVDCVTAQDALDAMTYTVTNPVAAARVTRADLWPGANILPSDLGRTIRVKRPTTFFRADGPLPDEVELTFVPPPGFEHLTLQAFQALWQQRVETEEARLQREAAAAGRTFMGRRAVLKQSRHASATSWEKRRGLKPRIKCKDKRLRIAAIQRIQRFCAEHHNAFKRFRDGVRDVVFPAGTYWMRVHANVCCAPG